MNKTDRSYVTKDDLKEALADFKVEIREEVQSSARSQTQLFKEMLLQTIDPLLFDMRRRQEEDPIVSYQISDVRETIENHEVRIGKLESIAKAT